MHESALPPEQRRALLALKPLADRGFYLAGGSALCLRLAHRRSVDLDLFREADFDPERLQRDLEAQGFAMTNPASEPSTLSFEVEGVPVSAMRFPYPNLHAPEQGLAVPVASLEDLAAMKMKALVYFDDAEREPELNMLKPVEWLEVRGFFEREVKALWSSR